ncbi:hypothetical protein B0H12DRAFT_1145071 [Mycena haematopus]|nr:hypothetical protein B0H12DRAFT_1145071 [Mycena haematopus]
MTLNHSHIIELLAVYFKNDTDIPNVVVRELMVGGTLSDFLSREDAKQWRDRVQPMGIPHDVCRDIAYQLCQAVAYMHGKGICHRNLNPDVRCLFHCCPLIETSPTPPDHSPYDS